MEEERKRKEEGIIAKEAKNLAEKIKREGVSVKVGEKETLELINEVVNIHNFHKLVLDREMLAISGYKDGLMSAKEAMDRWLLELNNYKSMSYSLKHKVIEVGYFFPDLEAVNNNRKIVVVNPTECISLVQLRLVNNSALLINCYMRSSDVAGLLPIDMLGLLMITRGFIDFIISDKKTIPSIDSISYSSLNVTIASAHTYV